jgi:aquaporin Z
LGHPVAENRWHIARSIGPAIFEGGQALSDLWVFIVGPFVGAAIAAGIWKIIGEEK